MPVGPQAIENRRAERSALQGRNAQVRKTKQLILDLYRQGFTADDACRSAGKSTNIWQYYRKRDPEFRKQADLILATRRGGNARGEDIPPFEVFSEKYLHSKLFNHQLQWVDLLEGREPRNLHPSQSYVKGDPDYIVVNTPPGHGKSTTLTMNYVTYRIVTDPACRVVIVSKTETMAKKFLQGIKRRLTGTQFTQMIADYAPAGGFEQNADTWTAKMIYFGHSESVEKDPNVEVLGIGQQIYGARADLIICDDIEDLGNVSAWKTHLDWMMQDVLSRDAAVIVIGTRVAPKDIYTELLNPENYDGAESTWTYLSQPAILEPADRLEDQVTLWPRSDVPHATHPGRQDADGLWPKWDAFRLDRLRRKLTARAWAMVYMQQPVAEDAIFTIEAINGSVGNRNVGVLRPGEAGLPTDLSDFYTVAGLDPATQAGFTAAVVLAFDRRTQRRYLLDAFNARVGPEDLRRTMRDFTERYHIQEWRVERNAFQAFLTQDREINQFMASRGVRLREHTTGNNKWDPNWGVATLASLFAGYESKTQLLDWPKAAHSYALSSLREQLVVWSPEAPKSQKTDLVMAFWFADLACRDQVRARPHSHFLRNSMLSAHDMAERQVVNINDYRYRADY